MATIDPNGVLLYQDTDNYTPVHTALNLAQSNLSSIIGANTQIVKTATVADRNAKATARGSISKSNPFVSWRADAADGLQLEYTTNGTTWRTIADKEYYDSAVYTATVFTDANMTLAIKARHNVVTVYGYGTNTIAAGVDWTPGSVVAGYAPTNMPSAVGILRPRQMDRILSGFRVNADGAVYIDNRTGANITGGWDAVVTYVR